MVVMNLGLDQVPVFPEDVAASQRLDDLTKSPKSTQSNGSRADSKESYDRW